MAYTATTTLDQRFSAEQALGASPFGVITGTIRVTSYNQTHATITTVTNQFKAAPRVVCDGVSVLSGTNYLTRWDPTDKCIVAYSALGTEVANGTDIGTVNFIAIGQLG